MSCCSALTHFLLATSCVVMLCLSRKEATQQQPVHHFVLCAGLL